MTLQCKVVQYFYRELGLQEGFVIGALPKDSRIVGGKEVSMCSGNGLFRSINSTSKQIVCWRCQCVADRWILTRGVNESELKRPVLNLYACRDGRLVMMTRDHIIPKSAGGIDSIENLRPGCEICNSTRGSQMDPADTAFAHANPHLINAGRKANGAANIARQKYVQERKLCASAEIPLSQKAAQKAALLICEIRKATKKIEGLKTHLSMLYVRGRKLNLVLDPIEVQGPG